MTESELSAADDAVLAAARAAYVATPPSAPPSLVESAMRTVATDLRPARPLPVPGGFVTDTAVANALRQVLDGDPAVVARRCRVEADSGSWRVELSVAVSYDHYDRHGDGAIRARVVAAAAALFGAVVGAVDIAVVDVFVATVGDSIGVAAGEQPRTGTS